MGKGGLLLELSPQAVKNCSEQASKVGVEERHRPSTEWVSLGDGGRKETAGFPALCARLLWMLFSVPDSEKNP